MRMTKIPEQRMTLSMLAEKFLMVKEAQHCGEKTLHDYRVQVRKFVEQSRNLVEYDALEQDVLRYLYSLYVISLCILMFGGLLAPQETRGSLDF